MSSQVTASTTADSNVQTQKLQQLLVYLSLNSPFYQALFKQHSVDINTIKTLADLQTLPFTTKEDLQRHNNDFLCVSRDQIIEYASTSGTLGSPVTIALTDNDLDRLAVNEYNSFACADGKATDIYQLMLTLDRQFMAGIAYYSGLRKMGAGIIRLGPGVPSLQWETIRRLKPTAIVAVPSFILKLIAFAKDHGIDLDQTSVKKSHLHWREHTEHRFLVQYLRQKNNRGLGYSTVFYLCFNRNANRVYGMQRGPRRTFTARIADSGTTGR